MRPTKMGVGGNRSLEGSLKFDNVVIDHKECCPLCYNKVAIGDKDREEFNGQAYHLYDLLKPGASQNGAKNEFTKLKKHLKKLQAQEQRSSDEEYELKRLIYVLESAKVIK